MRVRVVVLLAHEHDVGLGEVGEHALQVSERPPARIVDALGNVGWNCGGGRGRNRCRRGWLLQEDGAE